MAVWSLQSFSVSATSLSSSSSSLSRGFLHRSTNRTATGRRKGGLALRCESKGTNDFDHISKQFREENLKDGYEATEEEEKIEEIESDFIEVGYISKVHGLKGELRVKPTTDFPQLRFSKPGVRWLRARIFGKPVISQVELTAGRDHPGQKCWIISLRGINTVDQAKQIIGSTLLVREVDRPELEEGKFYTSDLVGMRVVLQATDKLVGVVANVFNFGASDLLQVLLKSTEEEFDQSNQSKPVIGASGQAVWVPFVEAIVPEVDMVRRELRITPPKGLLELNLRNDMNSKTGRRNLEWKERKKLQHRFAAAKKRLSEMGQSHLLEYLKVGRKAQNSQLIKQIVELNFKLFQHAMQSLSMPLDRFDLSIYANSALLREDALKISSECLSCASKEANYSNHELYKEELQLLENSKVAVIVVTNDDVNVSEDFRIDGVQISTSNSRLLRFQELILDYKRLSEVEGHAISIPLILVSCADEIRQYEEFFLAKGYFGLDKQKIWILEEEKLPIVGASSDSKKILMKSTCEILQGPTGSGGIFSLLSSHNIIDKLIKMDVEFAQVCSLGERSRSSAIEGSFLLGLVKARGAEMGIVYIEEGKVGEEADEFNMVFCSRHLNKMCKQIDKQEFLPVAEQRGHVELVKVGEGYVEKIHPVPDDKPNSYRFHSSIYNALNTCSPNNVSIVYVTSNK